MGYYTCFDVDLTFKNLNPIATDGIIYYFTSQLDSDTNIAINKNNEIVTMKVKGRWKNYHGFFHDVVHAIEKNNEILECFIEEYGEDLNDASEWFWDGKEIKISKYNFQKKEPVSETKSKQFFCDVLDSNIDDIIFDSEQEETGEIIEFFEMHEGEKEEAYKEFQKLLQSKCASDSFQFAIYDLMNEVAMWVEGNNGKIQYFSCVYGAHEADAISLREALTKTKEICSEITYLTFQKTPFISDIDFHAQKGSFQAGDVLLPFHPIFLNFYFDGFLKSRKNRGRGSKTHIWNDKKVSLCDFCTERIKGALGECGNCDNASLLEDLASISLVELYKSTQYNT